MQTVDPVNPNKIDEDEPLTQTNHNSVDTIKLVQHAEPETVEIKLVSE